jgi:glycosyltransferase involved in cell wall biosynthesis
VINCFLREERQHSPVILFNTWPAAFDCPGGGEVQLLKYEEHLAALGVRVLRYDPWNPRPQFDAADIVHYFSVQGGSGRFLVHVKEARRLPLIISPIVWIDRPEKYGMNEIGSLLRMADHILPNSQAECDQLAGLFGMAPALFSPIVNGVDEIFFAPAEPALFREHYGVREPFVLCMGNIEERKNQLRLIEALVGTDIRLVLAGQEREAEYAQQCRAVADTTVHFLGRLEHGSVLQRSAYAAAEAFVLPSTLETPGLAALEAAAAGCNLAITREGCTQEYFGDFAEYLDPYDPADIRRAVRKALNRPRQVELPAFIRGNYTWRHAAKQLLAVYHGLLDKHSG